MKNLVRTSYLAHSWSATLSLAAVGTCTAGSGRYSDWQCPVSVPAALTRWTAAPRWPPQEESPAGSSSVRLKAATNNAGMKKYKNVRKCGICLLDIRSLFITKLTTFSLKTKTKNNLAFVKPWAFYQTQSTSIKFLWDQKTGNLLSDIHLIICVLCCTWEHFTYMIAVSIMVGGN